PPARPRPLGSEPALGATAQTAVVTGLGPGHPAHLGPGRDLGVEGAVRRSPAAGGIPGARDDQRLVAELGQIARELRVPLHARAAHGREVVGEEEDPFHATRSTPSAKRRTTLAGAPTATEWSGTSSSTTLLAPITAPRPMCTPGPTTTFWP